MTKTRNILLTLYTAFIAIAATIYILGDANIVDMAAAADASQQTRFAVSTTMILLTIALLPLTLRLFKMKSVEASLQKEKAGALLRWGTLRICMTGLLLVSNTLLYYLFAHEATYGYLAVITMLTLPFLLPTMARCQAETATPEPPAKDNEKETDDSNSQL